MSQWATVTTIDDDRIHVLPCLDGKNYDATHQLSLDCWCRPTEDNEQPRVVVHNDRERGGFH